MSDTKVEVGGARANRVELEARRGIVRDENGVIVRSAEWKEARKVYLETKIEDMLQRIKNAKAEIKSL